MICRIESDVKGCQGRPRREAGGGSDAAFTLLEVLIAMGLFFMAVFAILDCTNQGLRAARALDRNVPDVGLVAWELITTNRIDADSASGDFDRPYERFRWRWDRWEAGTNGLYRFNIVIAGEVEGRPYESQTELLLWRPRWPRRDSTLVQ